MEQTIQNEEPTNAATDKTRDADADADADIVLYWETERMVVVFDVKRKEIGKQRWNKKR